MREVVIDASVALAWCFPDEKSIYAEHVLESLDGRTVLVPAIWTLEVVNGLLVGERRKKNRANGYPPVCRITGSTNGAGDCSAGQCAYQ